MPDFRLCFDRVKSGKYGIAFDRIDGSVISDWMRKYKEEFLQEAIQLKEQEHMQQKLHESKPFSPVILDALKSIEFKTKTVLPPKPVIKEKYLTLEQRLMQTWIKAFDRLYEKQKEKNIVNSLSKHVVLGEEILKLDDYLSYRHVRYKKIFSTKELNEDGRVLPPNELHYHLPQSKTYWHDWRIIPGCPYKGYFTQQEAANSLIEYLKLK